MDPRLQFVLAIALPVAFLIFAVLALLARRRASKTGTPRRIVIALVTGLAVSACCLAVMRELGGASDGKPWEDVSAETQSVLTAVLADIDPERRVDYHTHVAGQGNDSACWVNPRMQSLLHPKEFARFLVYAAAAGISDPNAPDSEFAVRLAELIRTQPTPARHFLLAFDYRYDKAGERDLEHSEFHVPNDYVWDLCQEYPDIFLPCVSVHPYRKDAIAELTKWGERGAKLVKWLPNSMGIDPADPICDAYYEVMVRFDMVLLTHVGEEQAVEAEADQMLANPLRLRRPLDAGVKVLAAHCASSGSNEDLDNPGTEARNFELFLRLMGEEKYEGLLFGEISTVTQINRYPEALEILLARTDLHPRLVNGSDYPLPAINVLYSTKKLMQDGFLTTTERTALNEIYDHNPLLFDLALKRLVRSPATGARFAPEVFELRDGLGF